MLFRAQVFDKRDMGHIRREGEVDCLLYTLPQVCGPLKRRWPSKLLLELSAVSLGTLVSLGSLGCNLKGHHPSSKWKG